MSILFFSCGDGERSINNPCDCYEWKLGIEYENGLNSLKEVYKNKDGKRFKDLDIYPKFKKDCEEKFYGWRFYQLCYEYSQYQYMEINKNNKWTETRLMGE